MKKHLNNNWARGNGDGYHRGVAIVLEEMHENVDATHMGAHAVQWWANPKKQPIASAVAAIIWQFLMPSATWTKNIALAIAEANAAAIVAAKNTQDEVAIISNPVGNKNGITENSSSD